MKVYWVNPVNNAIVESIDDASDAPVFVVACAGWLWTISDADGGFEVFGPKYVRLGNPPLRIAKRDDGNGITERSARIRTAGKEMSSSDDSNRLSSLGRGLYK